MKDLEKVVDEGIAKFNGKQDLTESDVDNYVNKINLIKEIMDEELLSNAELKYVAARIKSQIAVKIDRTGKHINNPEFKSWYFREKVNYPTYYWDRYKKYLEYDKHFSTKVVNTLDDVLDQLTDYLGNPNLDTPFQRRGLIIGDVQSGKTSNFIGLMCKASDVGYKLIVVLASTTDKLRSQTQLRVDEGFIGSDSEILLKKKFTKKGAGLYSSGDKRPVCVTSTTNDFNKKIANSMGLTLNQAQESIVFVIKKNVSVLSNLNTWIKSLNEADSSGKINQSILVIDDEADYASINTNKEDVDPTRTNAKIQELLSTFTKASYVGFTATPYANVFIDPDSSESMLEAPLFPKDYIYCLDAPTNYIGARNLFGDDIDSSIKTIVYDEYDENCIYNLLPLKHKKEATLEVLPNTLKKAVQEFFIANVIRDLRGATTSHRSMLINISRFVMVHDEVRKSVDEYVNSLKRSIAFYSKKDDESWKQDENMQELYSTYTYDFAKTCENKEFAEENGYELTSWEMVKNQLHESTSPIIVRVVNQKSKDDMDYEKHKEEGLRVIAIGGIALSRGLTLEGLIVSYFYRSTNTYDTLMQMGRWFGYRGGYNDLCRIWMTDDAQECYVTINRATEELRESIAQYKYSGLTPLDFGIKVRTDNNMLITARNKMRSTKEALVECTLSSKVVETKYLLSNKESIKENANATYGFLKDLIKEYQVYYDGDVSTYKGFKNVDCKKIIEYISSMKISLANIEFENEALKNYIKENSQKLSRWDVAIVSGHGDNENYGNDNQLQDLIVAKPTRQIDIKPSTKLIRVSQKRIRVGGPADGKFGISKAELEEVTNSVARSHSKLSQTSYFAFLPQRNPLLSIYMIEPKLGKETDEFKGARYDYAKKVVEGLQSENLPLVAISLGFPNLGAESQTVKYRLNKVALKLSLKEAGIDEGELEYDENDQ